MASALEHYVNNVRTLTAAGKNEYLAVSQFVFVVIHNFRFQGTFESWLST